MIDMQLNNVTFQLTEYTKIPNINGVIENIQITIKMTDGVEYTLMSYLLSKAEVASVLADETTLNNIIVQQAAILKNRYAPPIEVPPPIQATNDVLSSFVIDPKVVDEEAKKL